MDLLKSTIHLREYLYTTKQGTDIEYRALSYKELEDIQNKHSQQNHTYNINTVKIALLNKDDFYILTSKDIEKLVKNITEVSTVSTEEMNDIRNSVNILMDDSFKDDTFTSCELCQSRKLDTQRNCPKLPKDTHDSMVFYVVDGKKLLECPMEKANNTVVNEALRCYSMYEKGFIATSGGIYDMPMFFIETSIMISGVIGAKQAAALNKK